jgi:hypothetical protein
VFDEKPPEVTVANSEPAGETLDAGLIERALGDFPQRARDGSGGASRVNRALRQVSRSTSTSLLNIARRRGLD